ncbi:uncharacterized protein LOC122028888 [Zingiber officinale]|uniref:uncharacterized protein LOC122028888 n=1 Tax=Zingiber officinale TaxID=94328 RepID=UPI001C4DB078|nr:uncharacterized protein LOC122028888 [Zingiber officinale]XP_042443776.1 uncharacterized protein LOC122028888 [Zingiber officinale]XP_042443778.1 uncharacterized protein LOC122028888 [Zingiber officinale]XP_042443779.1 uncharacterized protein LOC122028888 [Zingiber officinale]XP_042443780.1 uncharacterized protein LOC122028888 [Zingiber officinale]XP_042443781.1 uncharacterized protein LOC122028888 [Zingiber officinale]XP_042443782.1 uncharacterized protein LOC122028888 [Zingiber officinal
MAETPLISLNALAVSKNEADDRELVDAVAADGTVLPLGEKEAKDREPDDAAAADGTVLPVGEKEENDKGFADVVAADGEEANPDRDTASASEDLAPIVKLLPEDFIRELMLTVTMFTRVGCLEENIRIMKEDASAIKLIVLERNKKLSCFLEHLEDKLKSVNSKFDQFEDRLKIVTENLEDKLEIMTSKLENSLKLAKPSGSQFCFCLDRMLG